MEDLFPEVEAVKLVRCKDCQFSNPTPYGNICIQQPTRDKRYKAGYIKVRVLIGRSCNKYKSKKEE